MSDESDKNIEFSIPKTWVSALRSYLVPVVLTGLLGGEGYMLWDRSANAAEGSEKYAIGIRCDAAECVYRDEHNETFEARRGKEGQWIYKRQGKWYHVSDDQPYSWWTKPTENTGSEGSGD